ncbi:MAG: hypothetical protein HOI88_00560 [Phycisphaerae bacterium]|jgi:hypothetical protein|nr:hypothetical protein [Phycisphaerae bacterium]
MQTIKSTTLFIASALIMVTSIPAPANATDQTLSPSDTWVGVITSDAVLVRCGANESYYPITTAGVGDLVLVNGKRQEWLKVDTSGDLFADVVGYVKYPSDDISSFLVAGTDGKVTGDVEVLAKNIESDELYRSWRPILRLHADDSVWVIDTKTTDPGTLHREAYVVHTIKMPAGGSGWINASFVKQATSEQVALFYGENTPAERGESLTTDVVDMVVVSAETENDTSASRSTSVGIAAAEEEPVKLVPLSLVELEAAWEKITSEPVMGAEVSPLKDLYSELLSSKGEDLVVTQIADGRIKQLDVWAGLQAQRVRIEALRSSLDKRSGEVSEFQTIMSMNEEYAMVGKLALSNTFDGRLRPLMYRVQDPESGRTLGYLPANKDFELSGLVGQRVGVVGKTDWNPTWRVSVVDGTRFDILSPTTAIVAPDIQ